MVLRWREKGGFVQAKVAKPRRGSGRRRGPGRRILDWTCYVPNLAFAGHAYAWNQNLTSDPKLRFGEEVFEAELGGATDGDGLGDSLENEICLVPGFSVDAGNLF